ncbi:MAG: lipoprotein signal peptidase [Saprospiraceae bacterium]
MKPTARVTLLILGVLIADQALKFYIKTNFEYNQQVPILGLPWANLHFVENEGMAFGMTFSWEYGKLMLSTFRILMAGGLIWYLSQMIKMRMPAGLIYSISLICAGAIGNIIDSAIYGLIFTESPYHGGVAQLVAPGQGYGTFLHGKVVDMFYFPLFTLSLPEWLGGGDFLFFSPIFNVADAAITTGIFSILLFQRSYFKHPETQASAASEDAAAAAQTGDNADAAARDENGPETDLRRSDP